MQALMALSNNARFIVVGFQTKRYPISRVSTTLHNGDISISLGKTSRRPKVARFAQKCKLSYFCFVIVTCFCLLVFLRNWSPSLRHGGLTFRASTAQLGFCHNWSYLCGAVAQFGNKPGLDLF